MPDRLKEVKDANARLAWTLARAVEGSARPRYAIAQSAGMHRETLQSAMQGEKPITLQQAARILNACDVPVNATLTLAIVGHEELAAEWMHNEMGAFLEAFLIALPGSLHEALGDRIYDLKPRWAGGTAKLLGRTLTQHIADLNRRGDAIGERIATPPNGA